MYLNIIQRFAAKRCDQNRNPLFSAEHKNVNDFAFDRALERIPFDCALSFTPCLSLACFVCSREWDQ